MIDIENAHIILPSSGGTLTISVEYPENTTQIEDVDYYGGMFYGDESVSHTGLVYDYTFNFKQSTTTPRKGGVIFSAYTSDNVWETAEVYLSQASNPSYGTLANDFNYTSAVSSFSYAIRTDDGVIFEGHAVKSPVNTALTINFNELFHNYVKNDIGNIYAQSARDNDIYIDQNAERDFILVDGVGNAINEYKVLDGYSDWNGREKVLSEPVNGHYDPRMHIVSSIYCPSATTKTINYTFAGITANFVPPTIGQPTISNVTE